MNAATNTNYPAFFVAAPLLKHRLYNGRKLMVFEGKVKVESIEGWLNNPRIDVAKRTLQEKVGGRDLTQEEIFDLMKNEPDVQLKALRDDIIKNGLREPLTLSFAGKLLDGNRRFFAVKFALETFPKGDPNRQDLELVEAYVLAESATKLDEENVLVEENFSASLKIEWPDYVKARRVVKANDEGMTPEEIAARFKWDRGKIRQTLRTYEIIQDFESFAVLPPDQEDDLGGGPGLTELEAQALAAKNYQFFNEAQKSFFDPLKTDIDFKIQFFNWILEHKFSSFPEVRVAYKAWKDPEARAAIMQSEPAAAKNAKAILDYNNRVVRNTDETVSRIESFIKFLKEMQVEQVKQIPLPTRQNLKEALELVGKMSDAAIEE